MPRLPVVSARKLIKVLKKAGFVHDRTEGSHHIYFREKDDRIVSVPVHRGKDLGRGITLSILHGANISVEEFLKLL